MAATKGQSKGREADEGNGPERHEKLDNKTYEREPARLHAELVKLQPPYKLTARDPETLVKFVAASKTRGSRS